MKKITILGSTGSIGTQALQIIKAHPKKFKAFALSANTSINKLLDQIQKFQPKFVALMDKKSASDLKKRLKILNLKTKPPQILAGLDGLNEIASKKESDIVLTAFVGSIGIKPTIKAIQAGKTIALANKETLVTAGEIIIPLAQKHKAKIIPVDSEHSAIFQCLMGEKPSSIKNLILTCSGGPFRKTPLKAMQKITVKQALNHPNWNMGGKITIDSSTLMNKGLEIIEAHWLFNLPYKNIKVLIHPQSLIHSLVEFKDNSFKAQIGKPTMLVPIQFSFTYPHRLKTKTIPALNLMDFNKMTFEKPNLKKFPCLNLALKAANQGGTLPTVLNAANEIAVQKFLNNQIKYPEIAKIVEKSIHSHQNIKKPSLDDILEVDKEIREKLK